MLLTFYLLDLKNSRQQINDTFLKMGFDISYDLSP